MKNIKIFYIKLSVLFIVYGCVISCIYNEENAKKYLPGDYNYQIPSGEFQKLKINQDFTFEQTVFSKDRKVLYQNLGNVIVDGNKIDFENWLECYELAEQKMIKKPFIAYSTGNYWRKSKDNKDIFIIMLDQTNYIFKKS